MIIRNLGGLAQSSGRGASAIRDGCRWIASLGELTDREAKEFGIGSRELIKLDITKSNYGPFLDEAAYFMCSPEGVLIHVNPHTQRLTPMAGHLLKLLMESNTEYSLQDLKKGPIGKPMADNLKGAFDDFNRSRDIPALINMLTEQKRIKESTRKTTGARGRPKKVLKPVQELR